MENGNRGVGNIFGPRYISPINTNGNLRKIILKGSMMSKDPFREKKVIGEAEEKRKVKRVH